MSGWPTVMRALRLPEIWVALVALALGLMLLSGQIGRSLAAEIFGLILTLGGGGWLVAALRRRRLSAPPAGSGDDSRAAGNALAPPTRGTGIAAVREGAIGYFGPMQGGVLARDALVRVSVVDLPAEPGRPAWRLETADGATMEVPAAAVGADALLDSLVTLPGFDSAAAGEALDDPIRRPAIVWEGPPADLGLRLRTGGGAADQGT